jgi:hypothetical protein
MIVTKQVIYEFNIILYLVDIFIAIPSVVDIIFSEAGGDV